MFLKNERLRLRAMEPEDLDVLYTWENDPSYWMEGNTLAPYSRYVLREYISNSNRGIYEQKQLRLMLEHDGQAAGVIDLYDFDPHNRRAAVGLLVDKGYQGQGIGTQAVDLLADYAFSILNLYQLYAYVPVSNPASRKVFDRCGFTLVGTLRGWVSAPGSMRDVWLLQRINIQA
ncbi:MAG: GNAT family N-acetyltransferase [Tannerella sp.]|nr:GNAT family N-acetyltransferase [Tannerella sp.]